MTAKNLTATVETLTYRELQRVLKVEQCQVKRNANKTVLRIETLRLAQLGLITLTNIPTSAPAKTTKRTKFDWAGCATDRKDAVKTLRALRDTGYKFSTPVKLNAANTVLLAHLVEFANSAPEVNIETPIQSQPETAKTQPATIATPVAVLDIHIDDLPDTLPEETREPEGPTLQERADALLKRRTLCIMKIRTEPSNYWGDELEDVIEELQALPARAFV